MIFPLKIMDRYLLRFFFLALLVVVIAVGFTIIVMNMVEELRDFIDHQVPITAVLEYYLYFAGWVIKSFFPLFVLLATLFSVALLARKNETLAMKASGLSLYRIAAPILFIALLLSGAHFYYNEYVFPPANKRRLEIKNYTIEKKPKEHYTRVSGIIRQISPGNFYTIGTFNALRGIGQDFKLYNTTANELTRIITARGVLYEDQEWKAVEGVERVFDSTAEEAYRTFDTLPVPSIKDKPEELAKPIGKPEDMSLDEIKDYIDLMKRTGGPYIRELVNLYFKYSYPLTSAIVVLICVPFGTNLRRSGVAVSFASGILIALVYFVLFRIMQSAGYNEKVPPWVAAWGVNILFFLVGLFIIVKAKK